MFTKRATDKFYYARQKIVLMDSTENSLDSCCPVRLEIKDCSITPENDYLFAILGKPDARRWNDWRYAQ